MAIYSIPSMACLIKRLWQLWEEERGEEEE